MVEHSIEMIIGIWAILPFGETENPIEQNYPRELNYISAFPNSKTRKIPTWNKLLNRDHKLGI